MHFTFRKRYLALLTPLAALAAIVFFAGGGGTGARHTLAGAPGPTTGVSCADVYLDSGFPGGATGSKKDLNGDTVITNADITSMSMTRTEPDPGGDPTKWDLTTVTYLGKPPAPALGPLGVLVAGGPPAPVSPTDMTCQASSTAALTSAEANRFGGLYEVPYSNQYGVRPSSIGTYNSITQILSSSSCGFSEGQGLWVRIDTFTHIVNMGAAAKNDGTGTLYLGAGAPTSGGIDTNGDTVDDATTDPTSCAQTGFAYHFVYTTHNRDARTDHWATSTTACGTDTACVNNVTLGIAQDADGPNPKVKNVAQAPDGTSETTKVADDWDGDGCPDWDELGRGYMQNVNPTTLTLAYPPVYDWNTHPVNGIDPFNPYDCNINLTATISLTTTIFHNTTTANPGNGQYFRCLGTMLDAKVKDLSNHRALSFRLGCYSDGASLGAGVINSSNPLDPYDGSRHEGPPSNAAPDNTCMDNSDNDNNGKKDAADSSCHDSTCPPAPSYLCGDGRSGQPPGGCVGNPADANWCANATAGTCPALPCPVSRFMYLGIDPMTYPVINPTSGNFYNTSDNTIHLGGCFAGFGGGTYGNVFGSSTIDAHTGAGSFSIFLNQLLADCTGGTPQGTPINGQVTLVVLRTEKGLTDNLKYDSDRDGCSDARELGSPQSTGGFRDPYNPWDYFDPEKINTPGTQTVADILKVVGQFGKNQNNALYNSATDRTGILGGQPWNVGAPDGQQTVADILISVKQFGHNCPHVTP